MFLESNPIPVKWAAARLGLITDTVRLPLVPLSRQHQAPIPRPCSRRESRSPDAEQNQRCMSV